MTSFNSILTIYDLFGDVKLDFHDFRRCYFVFSLECLLNTCKRLYQTIEVVGDIWSSIDGKQENSEG